MGAFSLGMMPMAPRMLLTASPSCADAPVAATRSAKAPAWPMILIPFMAPTIRFSLWPEGLIAHSGEHMAAKRYRILFRPTPLQDEGVIKQTDHPRNDGGVRHVEHVPGPRSDMDLDEIEHGPVSQPVDYVADRPTHDQSKR